MRGEEAGKEGKAGKRGESWRRTETSRGAHCFRAYVKVTIIWAESHAGVPVSCIFIFVMPWLGPQVGNMSDDKPWQLQ